MKTRSEVLREKKKAQKASNRFDTSKNGNGNGKKLDTNGEKEKKKKVAELSKELKEHLLPVKESPFHFETANPSRKVKLRPDLDYIVSVTFVVDLEKMWKKLHAGLTIGEKSSDHGTLNKALDEAETNAHDAHRLYLTANFEAERWEREMDTIHGAMWSEANRSLQAEKNDGLRSKMITDGDVKARIATLFPEEYQVQETRRAEIKATVESLKHLSMMWDSRCKSIGVMLSKLRG